MNAAERTQRVSSLVGTCILPAVMEHSGLVTEEGLDMVLRSRTFAMLSDPATGMWHLSAPTLAAILQRELTGDGFETPEEQS